MFLIFYLEASKSLGQPRWYCLYYLASMRSQWFDVRLVFPLLCLPTMMGIIQSRFSFLNHTAHHLNSILQLNCDLFQRNKSAWIYVLNIVILLSTLFLRFIQNFWKVLLHTCLHKFFKTLSSLVHHRILTWCLVFSNFHHLDLKQNLNSYRSLQAQSFSLKKSLT